MAKKKKKKTKSSGGGSKTMIQNVSVKVSPGANGVSNEADRAFANMKEQPRRLK